MLLLTNALYVAHKKGFFLFRSKWIKYRATFFLWPQDSSGNVIIFSFFFNGISEGVKAGAKAAVVATIATAIPTVSFGFMAGLKILRTSMAA